MIRPERHLDVVSVRGKLRRMGFDEGRILRKKHIDRTVVTGKIARINGQMRRLITEFLGQSLHDWREVEVMIRDVNRNDSIRFEMSLVDIKGFFRQ